MDATASIGRAVRLSKGTRGRILVLYILGLVLRWGLGLVLTIPIILVITLVPGIDTPQHSHVVGTIILLAVYGGSFAVRAFTKPVYAIAQLLFYFDQRIRKEGFDIEWMMRQAGMVTTPAEPPEIPPSLSVVPRSSPLPPSPIETGTAAASAGEPEKAPEMIPATAAALVAENGPEVEPDASALQPAPEESA